jgi:small GTP-binding protein
MGLIITKFMDTISSITKDKESKILILGLDGAGKTTLLYKLKLGSYIFSVPTIGFNHEKVKYKNLNMTIWDIGGQTHFRNLWRYYFADTESVIFIVDSTDRERLEKAKEELYNVLGSQELYNSKLLIFANKQDMGGMPVKDIENTLELHTLKRSWHIQGCSAMTGEGVSEGFDWLAKQLEN